MVAFPHQNLWYISVTSLSHFFPPHLSSSFFFFFFMIFWFLYFWKCDGLYRGAKLEQLWHPVGDTQPPHPRLGAVIGWSDRSRIPEALVSSPRFFPLILRWGLSVCSHQDRRAQEPQGHQSLTTRRCRSLLSRWVTFLGYNLSPDLLLGVGILQILVSIRYQVSIGPVLLIAIPIPILKIPDHWVIWYFFL